MKPFEVEFDEGYGYYLLTHADALGDAAHRDLSLVADPKTQSGPESDQG